MLTEQERYEIAQEVLGYTKKQLEESILSANKALDEVEQSCLAHNRDTDPELRTALEQLEIILILSSQLYKDWGKPLKKRNKNAAYICNMLGIDAYEQLTGVLKNNKPYDVRDTFMPELGFD